MSNIDQIKKELMAEYEKDLTEFFAAETFDMNFNQREKLITQKAKDRMIAAFALHLKMDPKSVDNNPEPPQTISCHCGAEGQLIKDKNGKPKIFERDIATKNGPITIKEYGYQCSAERKIFFPSEENATTI